MVISVHVNKDFMMHTISGFMQLAVGDTAELAAHLWYSEHEMCFVNSKSCQEHDEPHKLRRG